MKHAIKQLLVALLLIGAGLLSPSNGLDDKIDRDRFQMLSDMFIIMLSGITIFFVYRRLLQFKNRFFITKMRSS